MAEHVLFAYSIRSGCGNETVRIERVSDEEIKLVYRSKWMGKELVERVLRGELLLVSPAYTRIAVTHVDEAELGRLCCANLIVFPESYDFDGGTIEMEGMTMGGARVNDGLDTFNAMFVLDPYAPEELLKLMGVPKWGYFCGTAPTSVAATPSAQT